MFQNLKQNDALYVIDKSSGVPSLKIGQVVNVGNAMPATPVQNPGLMIGLNQQYQISIRAKIDGQEGDFNQLLTNESVHDYGNMIITDSRESLLSEIDKIRMKSQGELDRRDINEKTVVACDDMAKTVNPEYAKAKERDEAIANLGGRLDNIESMLAQFMEQINKKQK